MFCTTCGADNENGAMFCNKCGTILPIIGENMNKIQNVQTKNFKGRRGKKLITLIGVFAFIASGTALYLNSDFHYYQMNHKMGDKSYAEGVYEEALKYHKTALGYKNTEEIMAALCLDYTAIGDAYLSAFEYQAAIDAHKLLAEYGATEKDVNVLLVKDYNAWADSYLANNQYQEAVDVHMSLSKYGLTETEINVLVVGDYNAWADSYLANNQYQEAVDVHMSLSKYGLTETEINVLVVGDYNAWADNYLTNNQYQEAVDVHMSLSKYGLTESEINAFVVGDYIAWADSYLKKNDPIKALETINMGMDVVQDDRFREKAQYIKDNTVILKCEHDSGNSIGIEYFTYNEKYELVKKEYFLSGKLINGEKYTYDENGNLIQSERYDQIRTYDKSKYSYNEKNSLTKVETYNSKDELHYAMENIYDENNNLIKTLYYDDDGSREGSANLILFRERIYTYDEENKCIKEEADEGMTNELKTYRYDDKGNLQESDTYNSRYGFGITETYDLFGNIVMCEDEYANVSTTVYTYQYIGDMENGVQKDGSSGEEKQRFSTRN